jgi:hypothetical protein
MSTHLADADPLTSAAKERRPDVAPRRPLQAVDAALWSLAERLVAAETASFPPESGNQSEANRGSIPPDSTAPFHNKTPATPEVESPLPVAAAPSASVVAEASDETNPPRKSYFAGRKALADEEVPPESFPPAEIRQLLSSNPGRSLPSMGRIKARRPTFSIGASGVAPALSSPAADTEVAPAGPSVETDENPVVRAQAESLHAEPSERSTPDVIDPAGTTSSTEPPMLAAPTTLPRSLAGFSILRRVRSVEESPVEPPAPELSTLSVAESDEDLEANFVPLDDDDLIEQETPEKSIDAPLEPVTSVGRPVDLGRSSLDVPFPAREDFAFRDGVRPRWVSAEALETPRMGLSLLGWVGMLIGLIGVILAVLAAPGWI